MSETLTQRDDGKTDWEAIEREYRTGQLSIREIARLYGITHPAIVAKAAKHGWTRDLSAQVRREARARLVTGEVTETVTNAELVNAAANRAVAVVKDHRVLLKTGRMLIGRLVQELIETTEKQEEIGEAIEAETNDDRDSRRRTQMLRAVSLPARAATMRDLSAAMKNVVQMERLSYALDDDARRETQPTSLGSLIEQVVKLRRERTAPMIDITPAPGDAEKAQ